MKYIDEYRDPRAARAMIAAIRQRASQRWTLMEVCGGQTHGLLRYGITSELEDAVELIHGPGCPVCVTPLDAIDFAQSLALKQVSTEREIVLTSFGDMLRVPGSRQTLLQTKASGGNVRVVYSPTDAVAFAKANPHVDVVFFAVGFETTAPATALAVKQAAHDDLDNFSLLTAHVRVQPAMEAIMEEDDCRVEGFLAAGHVCTITGYESYEPFVSKYRVPVVVTGFEPLDLLEGILACVEQLESQQATVVNRYTRSVRRAGNVAAKDVVAEIFEVADCPWRGMGVFPRGGLRLKQQWHRFDARKRYHAESLPVIEVEACRSADVLAGRIKPTQCDAFGKECKPDSPLGAPMVSAEGACAAYFRYRASEPVGNRE